MTFNDILYRHNKIIFNIYIPLVSGSFRKTSRQSIKLVPLNGSPPIPMEKLIQQMVTWKLSIVANN